MPSIGELENVTWEELNKMTRQQLAKIAQPLFDAANKRLKRLAATPGGSSSPAFRANFSTKGKDVQALREEVKNVKNFMRRKTSTVKGFKDFRNNFEKRYDLTFRTEAERTRFYKAYRKFLEEHPELKGNKDKQYGSAEAMRQINEFMTSHSGKTKRQDILDAVNEWYRETYEESEEEYYEDEFEDVPDEDIPDDVDDVFRG